MATISPPTLTEDDHENPSTMQEPHSNENDPNNMGQQSQRRVSLQKRTHQMQSNNVGNKRKKRQYVTTAITDRRRATDNQWQYKKRLVRDDQTNQEEDTTAQPVL